MRKLTKEEFIDKARNVHGDEYDYSNVNYTNNRTKIEIICHIHGSFWQTPGMHLSGNGCPECAPNMKSTTERFIKKAKEIHGDRYDHSEVEYINSKKKVKIICRKHGPFWQTPGGHLGGQGCPECGGVKRPTTEEFKKKAVDVHGNKHDYSKVKYTNKDEKVEIICPIHGTFWQTPHSHLSGQGCPECGGTKKLTIEDAQKEAELKNGVCLSKVYKNCCTKLLWRCIDGHEFWMTLKDVNRDRKDVNSGRWCPKCHSNMGEEIVRAYFEKMFEVLFPNTKPKWLNGLELDGYNEDLGIAFEHQGPQHYKQNNHFHKTKEDFINTQKRDDLKRNLCKKHGVMLFEIPDVLNIIDLNELPKLLDDALRSKNIIPKMSPYKIKIEATDIILNNSKIKELQTIAKERGGKLLSTVYLGTLTHLEFECSEGHTWSATPGKIKGTKNRKGTWCPFCADKVAKKTYVILNDEKTIYESMFAVAKIFGTCAVTVSKWTKDGKIKTINKDGNKFVIGRVTKEWGK